MERQELQSKKDKLLTMLDEVDKRYNQYYHQMEALASSFEVVAGFGSAKPYTSVALNRISCHFRSLRDAIKEHIQVIREKLGEKGGELSLDEQQGGERIPILRYLDQRLRQQRTFHQQIGMVRPSWRPQRGLPESFVSALRAWLFEHFLHPYPKESEKMMLAKQTRLSKNQQQQQPENKTNVAFSSEPKPGCTSANEDDPQLHQMNRSADYDSLMNYHGFGVDDYSYIDGNNQQESRFSNGHHLHDFVSCLIDIIEFDILSNMMQAVDEELYDEAGQQGGRDRRNYKPKRRYAHDHRRGQTGPGSENAYRCQGRPRGGTDSGRSQHQSWERRDNYSRNYSNRQMIYREVQSKALAAGSRRRGSSGPQREKNHESTISPAQIGTSVRGAPLRKENTDLTNHQTPNDVALPQEAVEEAMGELREVMTQYTICVDPSESAARRERLKLVEEHGKIEQTAINMVRASLATQHGTLLLKRT
ncbi:hypothetical protein Bca4012_094337 [Brassica carinata]